LFYALAFPRSEAGWEIKKGQRVISHRVRFSSGSKDLVDYYCIPNSRVIVLGTCNVLGSLIGRSGYIRIVNTSLYSNDSGLEAN
jgi:hypothetical protein